MPRRGPNLDLKRAILDRIRRDKTILVWTPNDLLDLGARSAIDKALQRLPFRAISGASIADSTMFRASTRSPANRERPTTPLSLMRSHAATKPDFFPTE